MLPWMIRMSSTGRPTDWKVNSRTRITKTTDNTEIITLSREKETDKS